MCQLERASKRRRRGASIGPHQELAAQAMELGLPRAFVVLLRIRESVGDLCERALGLLGARRDLDDSEPVVRSPGSAWWRVAGQDLVELRERGRRRSLLELDACEIEHRRRACKAKTRASFGGDLHPSARERERSAGIAPPDVHRRGSREPQREREWILQRLGERDEFERAREGRIGMTDEPLPHRKVAEQQWAVRKGGTVGLPRDLLGAT